MRISKAIGREAKFWMGLLEFGHELPAEIIELADRVQALEDQMVEIGPVSSVPTTSRLVASGTRLEDAPAEHRRLLAEADAVDRKRSDIQQSVHSLAILVTAAVARHREQLILSIRPAIEALVERARPAAESGWGDQEKVLRDGDNKSLKAWRDLNEAEQRFVAYRDAWRSSLTNQNLTMKFDLRDVHRSYQYWARPELVVDAKAANRTFSVGRNIPTEPTLAMVAAEPAAAGFRLATLQELADLHESVITPIARRLRCSTADVTGPDSQIYG